MRTLIIKLGATGDVVRTSTLLHILNGEIDWVTSDKNAVMLEGSENISEIISWSQAYKIRDRKYRVVVNLEDTQEAASLLGGIRYDDLFGAYVTSDKKIDYTDNSAAWFDLSLISRFGKAKADQLKLLNRKTYQEMIFGGLGYPFSGETYFLPQSEYTPLFGDLAIARESGAVWPMKNWAYYDELKQLLEGAGYTVNFLPVRNTLKEHINDIKNHKYLISGDSLPMHIALGLGIKCLTIFTCTSPWEIYDYGLQKKVVSPLLSNYFYQRGFFREAVEAVSVEQVFETVMAHLNGG